MLQRIGFTGLGILVGILYWPGEAAVHAFIFDDAAFFDSLFVSDPHEIWMRMLISLAFIGFGWIAQRGINEQRELQTRLRRKRDRLSSQKPAYHSTNKYQMKGRATTSTQPTRHQNSIPSPTSRRPRPSMAE